MGCMEMFQYLWSEAVGYDGLVIKQDYWAKCGQRVSVSEVWLKLKIPIFAVVRDSLLDYTVKESVLRGGKAASFQAHYVNLSGLPGAPLL